jgi:hypothetical protein
LFDERWRLRPVAFQLEFDHGSRIAPPAGAYQYSFQHFASTVGSAVAQLSMPRPFYED